MALTLQESERLIQIAKAKAEEMGIRVSICVVDPRGDLIAAVRQDGARWFTTEVAWGKATAAALFRVSTTDLAERAHTPVMQSMMLRLGGRFVPGQGALPLKRGDEVIGAIGVSGATSQQDEEAAQAAVDALS